MTKTLSIHNFQAHGGLLKNLIAQNKKSSDAIAEKLLTSPRINLQKRQLCDLELLLNGGFSPLVGFMDEADYTSVVNDLRLQSGVVWPIPIVLDVNDIAKYKEGTELILCDEYGEPYALFTISSIYKPDKIKEAKKIYGTTDPHHFGVNQLLHYTGDYYLGGKVEGIKDIIHYDFIEHRHTPQELRNIFKKLGWKTIIGFQTRNPLHKVHYTLIKDAADSVNAKVLLHPSVGMTKDDDVDYITRTKCYIHLTNNYMNDFSFLSLLPLAMRMAGPREALLHAIIRKNYGCTHFIIGRDHASPGNDKSGKPYYGEYEAHDLINAFKNELQIIPVLFKEMVYVEEEKKYIPINKVKKNHTVKHISGTEVRRKLGDNEPLPDWLSFPEILEELRQGIMKTKNKGLTIFFTGLPSSGKSTLARMLFFRLKELQYKEVSLFDGDVIRSNLSKGLGFSKEDRFTNITRIGFVANEITKHKGIAICAAIAPYKDAREINRNAISKNGHYVEVYLSTPLKVCMERDIKGLYKMAKKQTLKKMTGIDDPYEVPENPEITINTAKKSAAECVEEICNYLIKNNMIQVQNGFATQSSKKKKTKKL